MLADAPAPPPAPAVAAARAPFVARLHAPGHHPRADRDWPITITARTYGGKPLSGRVRYEYLYGGNVVARRSNYAFRGGRFHDVITWPKRSVGIRLTFQPVVTTRLGVVRLPYRVVVRR
jgi:hypothetical protein